MLFLKPRFGTAVAYIVFDCINKVNLRRARLVLGWVTISGRANHLFTQSNSASCLFYCVLQPSSVRGLASPWTYFLHLSLSFVILTDFSTGSPVHVLMLSIQAVRGLPRLRAPGIVPCIISFSRQLPCFLMV